MPIDESNRAYFKEMQMLGLDRDGREILLGLTFEETEWYIDYAERRVKEEPGTAKSASEEAADRSKYLTLDEKHESTRMTLLSAGVEARHAPVRH